MKIIVTGGAGFIASHVVDKYIEAGHKVVVIDNLSTGFRKNINKKASFYKADIRDLSTIEKIFKKERPEIVNHHAAFINVTESVKDPKLTLEINTVGTLNIATSLVKYGRGPKKIIFSSTGGALYGDPKKLPANENTPTNLFSPYALSKSLAEQVIHFCAREKGLSFLIFRYANVFGPRQNPKNAVVPLFATLMKRGIQPTIFGDGSKSRDYVYVEDVADANLRALHKGVDVTLNIGTAKSTSDQDVFNALATVLSFEKKVLYAKYRSGEVHRITLDAKKAKKVLGWKPQTSFLEGIRKTAKTI